MVSHLGCKTQAYKAVSLAAGSSQAQVVCHGPQPIRLGLAPILSVQGGGEALAALCQTLSRRMDRPVVPLLGSDYREINDMLGLNQLDVGIICSGAYADPRLRKVCQPLLVPQLIGSGATYQAYIVVRAGNPGRSLVDLKGTSFEFTDSLSLTGYIYPVSRLCGLGQKPGTFFSSVGFSHSHDRSLSMVVDGSVAAASVDSSVFKVWKDRHPEEAKRLRILERSEAFPSPPIVVKDELAQHDKDALRRAFLDLADTQEGRAILQKIGWTGFQEPDGLWHSQMDRLNRLFGKLRAKNCLAS